jgi:hypothetical protein
VGSREHLLPNVTHTYIKSAWQSLLRSSSEASAAGWLRSNAETVRVK